MGDEPETRVATFEVASSKLREGLKCCRAMMASYRAMIAGEQRPAGVRVGPDASRDAAETAPSGERPANPVDPAVEFERSLRDW